eukprot:184653-Chlamydomonas_euryale.AAC.1
MKLLNSGTSTHTHRHSQHLTRTATYLVQQELQDLQQSSIPLNVCVAEWTDAQPVVWLQQSCPDAVIHQQRLAEVASQTRQCDVHTGGDAQGVAGGQPLPAQHQHVSALRL